MCHPFLLAVSFQLSAVSFFWFSVFCKSDPLDRPIIFHPNPILPISIPVQANLGLSA
jgi:hypothetical protein